MIFSCGEGIEVESLNSQETFRGLRDIEVLSPRE